MGIAHIVSLETDTVTEKPVRIPFDFPDTASVPEGKSPGDHIMITPLTVRTWFKMKPLLLQIRPEDLEKMLVRQGNGFPAESIEIINRYDNLLLDIICLGIHNQKSEPPQWFREVLKDNSTWEDIGILLNAILFRIGYNPFYRSITMLKNVSPMTEAEIIAAQKNAQSWTNL